MLSQNGSMLKGPWDLSPHSLREGLVQSPPLLELGLGRRLWKTREPWSSAEECREAFLEGGERTGTPSQHPLRWTLDFSLTVSYKKALVW